MFDRHTSISITAGTIAKAIILLVLAWLLFTLRDVVLIVLTAIVIASSVEPGVRAMTQRKVPRVPAVLFVYSCLFGIFFALFYFFLPSLLEDFVKFMSALPTYLEALGNISALDTYTQLLGLPDSTNLSSGELLEGIRTAFNLGTYSNAFTAVNQIFGGFLSFILIIVFSFYFAVVETGVDDFLRVVTPKSHQAYILGLWQRSQRKIGLWMQGQLLLAVVVGVLVFLGLTIFGVPHALMLAVIAGVFEIIPVFGPTLAAIPAAILGFASGGLALGLIVIGIYAVVQLFENHLIYPLVVTRVVGVPPLLVILGLIIGAELAGFLGIILSVPIAATLQEFVRDIEAGRLPKRENA